MSLYQFSFNQILTRAWATTKQYYWFLFCLSVIALLMRSFSYWFPPLDFLVGIVISISVTYVMLKMVRGHAPTYRDLVTPFTTYTLPLKFLLVTILVGVAVIVGLFLFIIPGIYLAIRLQFYRFVIFDKPGLGIINIIKESMGVTKGKFWKLFWFSIVIILMNIVGLLLLIVGLFVTIPLSLIAYAELYKDLSTHQGVGSVHDSGPRSHPTHDHAEKTT